MSDFVLIVTRNGEPAECGWFPHADASEGRKVVFSRQGLHLEALLSSHDAIAYRQMEETPDKQAICLCFGWCYRMDGAGRSLLPDDLRIMVEGLRKNDLSWLQGISGTYTLVIADALLRQAWVFTDKWSMRGFYYGAHGECAVAASKAGVVAHFLQAQLDGVGLLALLRGTKLPPGRTLFERVYRSTPGRALAFDLAEKSALLTTTYPVFQPPQSWTLKESVERLATAFVNVVALAAREPHTIVDLTGGNDSRLTAAALSCEKHRELGKCLVFKTIGAGNHPDVIIARRIAELNEWELLVRPRDMPLDVSLEDLKESTIMLDGNALPDLDAVRSTCREKRDFGSFYHLLGSLGGELSRDFFWRHELWRIGRTPRVNFDALLRYRLYAERDLELSQIFGCAMTFEDHDEFLLEPYRSLDRELGEVRNTYKLDLIYLHRLANLLQTTWGYSSTRTMMLPYLTSEVTDVSLRIPWKHRLGRRVLLRAVELLNPALSAIATASGATMAPLRLKTLHRHIGHLAKDVWQNLVMRSRRDVLSASKIQVPQEWREGGTVAPSIEGFAGLPENAQGGLSRAEYSVLCAHLMLSQLVAVYPGIKPRITFDAPSPVLGNDVRLL